MAFSLDQLVAFQTAAQSRSFSEAARKMGKVQSAISTAISDLEIDLGVALFDRSGRYPLLTVEGETLLQEVEAILSHCHTLREQAGLLLESGNHSLTLAVEDAVPAGRLVPVLADLQDRFAGLQIAVICPSDLVRAVADGTADFGMGCARGNYPSELSFIRVGNVTLTNVVRSDHPLANRDHVRFSHLRDHTRLALRGQFDRIATSEYLKSPRCIHVESQNALLELLREGAGWATVPGRLVTQDILQGVLTEINLNAYPKTDWTVGIDLLWKSSVPFTAVGARLKSLVLAMETE
ncbi:LysR family transcriptional regulator [Paracoccus sp. CPCC 101403]|uniref:LysR family transcriptional regulator n=1 Tax=Paracoccus broussonetiae TaxID=3075834 RepID=A0ABU3EKI9_9RHOB|nr:LysR family transcriptional regulator [Paracoccus sp. CPCC 101403]MDT1064596.1 LysR family transcriptional regulator [Paracoccus sp. CPCC 101403]